MNITSGIEKIKPDTFGFIYLTTNNANGKKYIGQRKIDKRNAWKDYIGSGVALTRAVKKYGPNAFSKEILDVANCEDELNEKEIFWISQYDANRNKNFYNITPGGQHGLGWREYYQMFDPEKYKEISLKRTAPNKKPVNQLDSNGVFIKQFPSAIDASIETGISFSHICSVCRGNRKCAGGYCWQYANDDDYDRSVGNKGNRTNHRPSNKRAICQYDMSGKFLKEYDSVHSAAKMLDVAPAHISGACNGKRNSAYGFFWGYSDGSNRDLSASEVESRISTNSSEKKVSMYSLDGEFICEHESIKKASEFVGCSLTAISRALKSKSHKSCGYIWKLAQ